MSRAANGTYSLPAGNPVVTNSVISSTWANTTLADIAATLTDSLSRSGLGSMTAGLPLFDGTIGLPGLTFGTETTAGLRRASAGNFRFVIGGVDVLTITAAGITGTGLGILSADNVWTGFNSYTRSWTSGNTPAMAITSAVPLLELEQTGAAANNRKWWWRVSSNNLEGMVSNDARNSFASWINVGRTNNTINTVQFFSVAVTFDTANLSGSGTGTWTGKHEFNSTYSATNPQVRLNTTIPAFYLTESGAAANNKTWRHIVASKQYSFTTANDADNSSGTVYTIDRTGTTVDRVTFPTDSDSTVPFSVGAAPVSSGALAIFSTASASTQALVVRNITAATSAFIAHNAATSGDNVFAQFLTEGSSGTARGSISFNRGGGLTAFNVTSDGRLKKNIRNSAEAGSLIDQIKVRAFEWKEGNASLPHWFVAQELEPLVPYAVTVPSDPEGNWSIDPSKLVPLLVKAVQELRMRVAAGGL